MNFIICLTVPVKMLNEEEEEKRKKQKRSKYVDKYYTHHSSVPTFCSLMNMTSKSKNVKLPGFISCIFELF